MGRFGETIDQATALTKLRKLKRKPGESIQVFAERLYAMGESAYGHALLNNPVVHISLHNRFKNVGILPEKPTQPDYQEPMDINAIHH